VTMTSGVDSNIQILTDNSGAYSIRLPVDEYEVTALLNGYLAQTVSSVGIDLGGTTTQDFNLYYLGLWTAQTLSPCSNLTRYDAEYFPGTGVAYILGGRYVYKNESLQDVDTTVGTIYAFDPTTGSCSDTSASMPTPISNYTIALIERSAKELLCTFGGRTASGSQTLAVQCYDPVENSVTQIATLPADPYTDASPGAQVVVNNQVYLFGGIELNAVTAVSNIAHTFRYDPVANLFTRLGDLKLARGYIQAAVVDGQIYAFGGDVYDGASTLIPQAIAEVMADPEGSATWDDTAIADLPIPAGEGRAFGFDNDTGVQFAGKVVIAALAQYPGTSYEVITYNTISNTYYMNTPNLNIPRRNHAAVFIPIDTPDIADGFPGMWVLGGFCTGGTCGGDLQPYGVPEFLPVYQVMQFYVPILLNSNSR
jgi:hypothetical protein